MATKSTARSEYTTTYVDGDGQTVHAAYHAACMGKGCKDCNGLGFTKTVELKQAEFLP